MNAKTGVSRWLFLGAVFIAASALGGLIKMPSPVGSIAFDSAPGYFLAAYIHPILGGIVGSLGHLASAASGGFPLGYVHVWVALQMFLWCLSFGYLARLFDTQWSLVPAIVVAVILNGLVGPYSLGLLGAIDMAMAKAITVFLSLASLANVLIAALAVRLLASSSERTEPR